MTFICLILVAACSANDTKVETNKKKSIQFQGNLFNPIYLVNLFEAPNNFGPIWNIEAIDTLSIHKISLFVRGGRYKNNMSEKLTYIFDENGHSLNFKHYLYNISTEPFSNSGFCYAANGSLEKIDIFKYMEFGNIPPIYLQKDSLRTTVITSKSNNNFDSLVFYPNINNPKLIVEIVNHQINSLEIFVGKGAKLDQIQKLPKSIDTNLNTFLLAEKSVTFMLDNVPVESYRLDANWNKQEQSRTWEYNQLKQPTKYSERLHGTLIKDIVITYDENNLPYEFIVDRKKFIFHTVSK